MMEAVARRKAHWLFRAGTEKRFAGTKRPQEDMVTSAVFGSIRLMSEKDRPDALRVLLGSDIWTATGFGTEHDIDVDLWPRLDAENTERYVEPDVLLKAEGRIVVIEVKWHAPLSSQQLERQAHAAGLDNVSCIVLLGEAGGTNEICGIPGFRRTWRDVSGDLQTQQFGDGTPLGLWCRTLRDFLQETDMGRVFKGLSAMQDPGRIAFHFDRPGHPPWFDHAPTSVQAAHLAFEGNH